MKLCLKLNVVYAIALIMSFSETRASTDFPFPSQDSGAYEYVSGLLCYISGGLDVIHPDHSECLTGTSVPINESAVTDDLQSSLRQLAKNPATSPPQILDWWDRAQLMTRKQRRQSELVTDKLSEFVDKTNFRTWPRTILNVSMVKRLTRVIYRSPSDIRPAMSVAVTYESQNGDLSKPVRETEVAIEREDGSGNADFYVYDHDGKISTTSTFPSGDQPSPSSCLSCHFNRNSRTYPRSGL
ncbi:MAG: hypothetical protein NT027_01945 [Proteobacteria bacterium]|nr:hypothetical protein [Pseudomonadota bacterium]